MQLLDVLAPMRSSAEEALATQIEVFEDSHHGDQAQLEMPGDVDISSHSDLFTAVFARVCSTPNSLSFLNILQNLLLIDPTTDLGTALWTTVAELCRKAVQVEEAQEADKLKTSSIERIRLVLREQESKPPPSSAAAPPLLL
ncbi:Inverted formin-2, partial [Geodia barretti]